MAERKRDELQNEGSIPELEELAGSQPAAAEAPAAETAPTTEVPPMPTYDDAARQRQSALYEQIANRGPFRYDAEQDPLYRMARDRYVQNGRMSMKDTMGRAAALTGGYGSSYGQAVGQQAYDRQLQGLADMIPELYQTAYARYRDEGDRLKDLYSMAGAAADKDYDRYRDALGDWQYERAWAQQQDETAYGRQSEAYSRLYALIGATGYMPSAEELAAAGMTQEAADAIRNEYLRQTGQLPVAGGSGGGYYGGSGGSGGGGKKYTLQDVINDVSGVKHSNQRQDFYMAYQQAIKNGTAGFTQKELDDLFTSKHW